MLYYVFISQKKPEPLDDDIEIGNIIGYNLIFSRVRKNVQKVIHLVVQKLNLRTLGIFSDPQTNFALYD